MNMVRENISIALSTSNPSDLLRSGLSQVPHFADGFFNQVVNGLDYMLEDSLVKYGSKFTFLGSRSLAAYALVVSPTYGLIFENKCLAQCLFFFGVKWLFKFVCNFR